MTSPLVSSLSSRHPYRLNAEFHHIAGNLYQGSRPPYFLNGFDAIVFCALEHQPSASVHLAHLIHAPNDDADRWPTEKEMVIANRAAAQVASHVRQKRRVLITCMAGRNRSGLVTALAIVRLLGCSGRHAAKFVQDKRPSALTNPHFVEYLETVRAR